MQIFSFSVAVLNHAGAGTMVGIDLSLTGGANQHVRVDLFSGREAVSVDDVVARHNGGF